MARLGSKNKPVRFRVQTEEKSRELAIICDKRGWMLVGATDENEPEDTSELDYLLNPEKFSGKPPRMKLPGYSEPVKAERKPGRNAPCPCGSGKKYKKCCMGK